LENEVTGKSEADNVTTSIYKIVITIAPFTGAFFYTVNVIDAINILNEWAPEETAQEWDNVGLLIGSEEAELSGILVALDATRTVVIEAIETNSNLIITHHPIIFNPLLRLKTNEYPASVIIEIIKNDISVYSMHTNLDAVSGGVNDQLAKSLKLTEVEPLGSDAVGYLGRIGKTIEDLKLGEFLDRVKTALEVEALKYQGNLEENIKTVAICSGSGGSFIESVVELGADVFISSDFKHSHWLQAENRISLVDAGHYESEQVILDSVVGQLKSGLSSSGISVKRSEAGTNPLKLFNGMAKGN